MHEQAQSQFCTINIVLARSSPKWGNRGKKERKEKEDDDEEDEEDDVLHYKQCIDSVLHKMSKQNKRK